MKNKSIFFLNVLRIFFSPHPYLFFNPDHNTMTFVGFTIDRWTGNLMDYKTKKVIEKAILPKDLGTALYQNNVNMNEDFDRLERLFCLAFIIEYILPNCMIMLHEIGNFYFNPQSAFFFEVKVVLLLFY